MARRGQASRNAVDALTAGCTPNCPVSSAPARQAQRRGDQEHPVPAAATSRRAPGAVT